MKRVFYCLSVDSKQFLRSKAYLLAFLALFVYTVLGFLPFIETKDFLNMLYGSQYAQILAMAFFMVLGLQLGAKDRRYQCADLLAVVEKGPTAAAIARACCGLLICAAYFAAILTVLAILAAFVQATPRLYWYGFAYGLLRVFLPTFLAFLLGMTIGLQVQSSWKYPLVFLSWLLLSPLSSLVSGYVFDAFHTDSRLLLYFFSILNLGTPISLDSAAAYGFNLEGPFWLRTGIALALTAIFYFSLSLPSRHSGFRQIVTSAIYILCVLTGILCSYTPNTALFFTYYGYKDTKSAAYDGDYYHENYTLENSGLQYNGLHVPNWDQGEHVAVRSYEIWLETGSLQTSVQCTVKAERLDNSATQSFTLYRNFSIRSIAVDGDPVPFQQDGDYLSITFPKEIQIGDTMEISFSYQGVSSPLFPGNETMTFFPSTFPWLPRPGMMVPPEKSYYAGADHYVLYAPIKTETAVRYVLHYENSNPIYTNLQAEADEVFSGDSQSGLTVLSASLLNQETVNDSSLFYPESVAWAKDDIVTLAADTQEQRHKIFAALDLPDPTENFDDIVILPGLLQEGRYNLETPILNQDFAVYLYGSENIALLCENFSLEPEEMALTMALWSSVCNTMIFQAQNYDQANVFVPESLQIWYLRHFIADEPAEKAIGECEDAITMLLETLEADPDADEATLSRWHQLIQDLKQLEDNPDSEIGKSFYQQWYSRQMKGQYSDLAAIETMIDEVLADE